MTSGKSNKKNKADKIKDVVNTDEVLTVGEFNKNLKCVLDEKGFLTVDKFNDDLDRTLDKKGFLTVSKFEERIDVVFEEHLGPAINKVLDERLGQAIDKALDERLVPAIDKALDKRDLATKSYISEVIIEQRKEFEQYMGALIEDFNDKIKSMGEGISMILERGAEDSEKNRREHEWFKSRIARLEAKVV